MIALVAVNHWTGFRNVGSGGQNDVLSYLDNTEVHARKIVKQKGSTTTDSGAKLVHSVCSTHESSVVELTCSG